MVEVESDVFKILSLYYMDQLYGQVNNRSINKIITLLTWTSSWQIKTNKHTQKQKKPTARKFKSCAKSLFPFNWVRSSWCISSSSSTNELNRMKKILHFSFKSSLSLCLFMHWHKRERERKIFISSQIVYNLSWFNWTSSNLCFFPF